MRWRDPENCSRASAEASDAPFGQAAGVFLCFPSCTRLGGGKTGEVAVAGACNTTASISSPHRSPCRHSSIPPSAHPIPSLLALRLGASATHHHQPSRHRPVLDIAAAAIRGKHRISPPARPRAAARHRSPPLHHGQKQEWERNVAPHHATMPPPHSVYNIRLFWAWKCRFGGASYPASGWFAGPY